MSETTGLEGLGLVVKLHEASDPQEIPESDQEKNAKNLLLKNECFKAVLLLSHLYYINLA